MIEIPKKQICYCLFLVGKSIKYLRPAKKCLKAFLLSSYIIVHTEQYYRNKIYQYYLKCIQTTIDSISSVNWFSVLVHSVSKAFFSLRS